VPTPSTHAALLLFVMAAPFFTFFITPLSSLWSRRHEFEADRFAAEALHDPNPLIQALKRLSKDSLSNLTPHPLLVSLHFTHPPILARVQALREITR